MCAKKVRSEIDSLRGDVQSLSEAVWALRDHVTVQSVAAAAANGVHATTKSRAVANDLAERAGSDPDQGIVSVRGYFLDANGAREYRWDLERPASDLLAVDEDLVARMLAAIGHKQRLLMLKAILDKPSSAAELVSSLNLGTTGAAYHHLNVLQAADLVTQEGRGTFIVQPHRVSAILAILAGFESASGTTYTDHGLDDLGGADSSGTKDVADGASTGGKRKKRKGS